MVKLKGFPFIEENLRTVREIIDNPANNTDEGIKVSIVNRIGCTRRQAEADVNYVKNESTSE
ncbi:hypothetical protein [uncultured Megasphaera sp.]|uniref:hypothetical protein n=1 Tax=uncultured Megasphaera sp. TaxID=165188 RepID=UPI0025CCB901|nr:hypothetical protein [uncultured Megasphaera sp.]